MIEGQDSTAWPVLSPRQSEEVLGMKTVMMVAAATLLASGYAAIAQDADIEAGAAYASQVCAACHAVLPN